MIEQLAAELVGLEQGMLQLRLQQQEADAQLRQINDAIQQQAGGIAALQRVLARLRQAEAMPAQNVT